MGRPYSLRTLTACALLLLAGGAEAAEITRVASAAEPDNPFDLDLSVRWERTLRRAKITREGADSDGNIADFTELRYEQVTNQIIPRIAVGLYHDLEIHAELPYWLSDNHSWRYAFVNGEFMEGRSSIPARDTGHPNGNTIDANGDPCPGGSPAPDCSVFTVPSGTTQPPRTVYHGGSLGDLTMGVSWGILSEKRDATKPSWLVGLDVTMPTAATYDPFQAHGFLDSSGPKAPVGRGIWSWDFYTALSKQHGPLDAYFRAHWRLNSSSSKTYSNCIHAGDMAAGYTFSGVSSGVPQMVSVAPANCAAFGDAAGAKPPTVLGAVLGVELVPYQDKVEGQRVAFDLRLSIDRYGESRWYNELTDATGKLLRTGSYLDLGGLFGFYLRASRYLKLFATASYHHEVSHLITGEAPGTSLTSPVASALNPNFDFRYDVPGRRFRVAETVVFTLAGGAELNF